MNWNTCFAKDRIAAEIFGLCSDPPTKGLSGIELDVVASGLQASLEIVCPSSPRGSAPIDSLRIPGKVVSGLIIMPL